MLGGIINLMERLGDSDESDVGDKEDVYYNVNVPRC